MVPEFDMPGHSTAWLVGYPELASLPGPYEIERRAGIFDPTLDPTEEDYKFLDTFIGEMAGIFPDHICTSAAMKTKASNGTGIRRSRPS